MKHRWSLKGQNKGASLLAVLVALIFVGILGVIITNITITNIRMREIEQSSKKNFYSAEEVLDDLTVGLNEAAAKAMQKAYADIMVNYHSSMTGGVDVQKDFTKLYIENLKDIFYDSTVLPQESFDYSDPMNPVTVYQEGTYLTDHVKDCFSTVAAKNCFATDAADAIYDADYKKGTFILKNICVSYTDALNYTTTITTDIVFHTPSLNSAQSNVVQEFMKYALIADVQIEVGSPNVTVDGSVYAGKDGIVCKGSGNGVFTGKTIVTRGDITTESGTSLAVGTDQSRIWAENITTEGNGPSTLQLTGTCYIADDLSMNGTESTVVLDGRYFGYNFQKQYGALQKETDSAFSSAMMINAKGCHLNLEQVDYLLLAGRTFISRGSAGNVQNNDIMTGESLSVRTNQLAYYVPVQYVDTAANPLNFTSDGRTAYEAFIGVANIGSYLNASSPITAYYYRDNGIPAIRYYLNFTSEQRANDFFAAYYAANGQKINANAASYAAADALVVDTGTLLTLKGDILYRDAADAELEGVHVTLSNADWEPGTGGAADGDYWTLATEYAATYKSLQKSLKEDHTGIAPSDVRFLNTAGQIDKSVEPLFETFIDKPAFQAAVGSSETLLFEEPASGVNGIPGGKRVAVVIDNNYEIPPEYREGIVIATGDVKVMGEFTGMILSGGTISFATNATVHAADGIVSQLFSVLPEFRDYFKDYDSFSESVLGMIQIEDYLTYDNWKKNGD